MIKKTDIFGYSMSGEMGWEQGCPKCKLDSLVNLNFNDKITCVNPKCDWEWNRNEDRLHSHQPEDKKVYLHKHEYIDDRNRQIGNTTLHCWDTCKCI